ncbi:MAG: TlyA family RNA methyltransferase [Salinarimonadaceae bacterium]|nr:MAG: TlyA family RNA methyltransferase [Salinarimonadaceae bacterium]
MSRKRADLVLVERGFFESRAQAQAAIKAGLVEADGAAVRKPSDMLLPDCAIRAEAPHPYVSRGGVKLAAALDAFGFDPKGAICLDLGASTGGFTDVLLQRGAKRVHAVDVGHGQLHPRIARDPRVVAMEGTDARALTRAEIPEPVNLLVADVSFISVRLVVPPVLPLLAPGARIVLLIKPQFEAGRAALGKGGVVRDESVQEAVCDEVARMLADNGVALAGLIESPILGGEGNREFLIGGARE